MGDLDFLDLRKLVPDKTLETFCEAFTPNAYYSFQKVDAVCAGSPKAWGTRMGDLHFLITSKGPVFKSLLFSEVYAVWAVSPSIWGTRMGDLDFLDLKKLVRGTTLFEASLPRGPIPDVM